MIILKYVIAWNCDAVKACDDKLGFDAILTLHQRLDDDADGNIDIVESDEVKYCLHFIEI